MRIGAGFGRLLRAVVFVFAVACASIPTAYAAEKGVSGVTYTLTPTIEALRWSGDMGLKDTELYGGRLGIGFGRLLSLEGYYLGHNGTRTDLAGSGLTDGVGGPLLDQDLEARSVGADLVINLTRGNMVPFVKAGAGVLKLRTADGDENNEIGLRLGGGLRFGTERLRFMTYIEDAAYRADRAALAAGSGFPVDPMASDVRHNLAFGAGLDLRLGGERRENLSATDRALMERYQAGLSGISWPIEPFYERITFTDVVGLPDQDFIGLRTGLDFGSHVGLRGWFAQGVNSSFDGTTPVQTFGGELFFNLNTGQGAIPYLIAGIGKLDFESAYRDPDGNVREDEPMLTLGGGLAFTLSDRVRVDLSLRDHIISQADLDMTSSTDQLAHNWGWSAGVRMALGGGRSLLSPAHPEMAFIAPEPVAAAPVQATMPAATVVQPEPAAVATTPALPAVEAAPQAQPEAVAAPVAETVPAAVTGTAPATAPTADVPAAVVKDFHGERSITIPLPVEGEIYLRYGRPGGVNVTSNFERRESDAAGAADTTYAAPSTAAPQALDLNAVRALLREELENERRQQAQPAAGPGAAVPVTAQPVVPVTDPVTEAQRLEQMERRLMEQMDARVEQRARELAAAMTAAAPAPSGVVVERADPRPVVVTTGGGDNRRFHGFDTFTGMALDDPKQFILGGRLDLGPVSRGSRIRFVPELSLGFGGGATSYMTTGNFTYQLGSAERSGSWAPFMSVGVGILGFSDEVYGRTKREGVLNFSYGATVNTGDAVLFLEHQGIDLFDVNRLLLGLRWPMGN
ncbi:MAG TPA: hypothetical protein P5571_15160 [Candidatus Krumholzibacteria bacterium]|nr:hypothetical protein [Candidatus Krumholzibacteria bacterium]